MLSKAKLAVASVAGVMGFASINAHAVATSAVGTDVTDQLTQMSTDIVTVGTGILAVAVLAISFKWIKGALFG